MVIRNTGQSKLFFIRIVVSLSLMAFLLYRSDTRILIHTLFSANILLFVLAIFLSWIIQGIDSIRMYFLLRARKIVIPLWSTIKIMITGTFLGTFMPTSLGTEVFRAYGFSNYTTKSIESTSAVIINRFVGLISLTVIASMSAIWEHEYAVDVGLFWIILVASMPLLLLFVGFSNKLTPIADKMPHWIRDILYRILNWIDKVIQSFIAFRAHKKVLVLVFILSICFQVIRIYACYILTLAMGVRVPFSYFFIFTPLVLLMTMLPFSVAGIGMREGGVVFFLGKVGIQMTSALSVSLLWFIAAIFSSLPGLLFYLSDGMHRKRESNK